MAGPTLLLLYKHLCPVHHVAVSNSSQQTLTDSSCPDIVFPLYQCPGETNISIKRTTYL
ncbi:uncharacterized protein LOC143233815 isoform X2 [Tachypleus tridentatus]|uniref:uncharacterized protein LOC143233815 isoform X2 n=1 Tax=Tachypleus tridentatus TaxID=6853 RepID=UPI003FD1492F